MMARQRVAQSIPPQIQSAEDVLMKDGNQVEESKEDGAQIVTTDMVEQEEDLSNYVTVDGIIIKQDFDHLIMEESEVDKYTPLQSASMQQTLYVPY